MKHLQLRSSDYEFLLKDFDEALKTIGYNGRKENYYSSNAREFLFFLEQNGINYLKDVISTVIDNYIQHLCCRKNYRRSGLLSPITIRHQMTSLKLFFEHLMRIEYLDYSPVIVPGIKPQAYKRRNIATTSEIRAMFNASPNIRAKAILACAYGCGLRRAELERLNQSDINFTNQVLVVRIAKGGKSREIPISDEMITILRKYNRTWRSSHSNPTKPTNSFLLSDMGARLGGAVMNQMLKSVIYRTNINV